MADSWPDWRLYERLVARLLAEQASTDLCVTPNASIKGKISKVKRQIDVLVESRHDREDDRRIIVDAKKRARKIDVKDVESFRGMMKDVGATHGYIVCPCGHTPAAEKRAQQAVRICLLPLDRLEDFDPRTWPRCSCPACKDGRVFWDGHPEISLTLLGPTGNSVRRTYIHDVGKCERCGGFHVSCKTCGETFHVPEDDDAHIGHQCGCRQPFFWLASVERDEKGRQSAELHVVMGLDEHRTVNRRTLTAT